MTTPATAASSTVALAHVEAGYVLDQLAARLDEVGVVTRRDLDEAIEAAKTGAY